MKTLTKQVEENLGLTGKKKENFIKQAQALRANIAKRKKQQEDRKCMLSK